MNVEETTFYECIRSIIKHFQCSVKDKEILDTCLGILELGKMHLSWCGTRMAHFLDACMFLRTWLLLCMMQCLPSPYGRRNVINFFHLKIFLYSSSWLMFGNVSKMDTLEKLIPQMPSYDVFVELLIPHHQKYPAWRHQKLMHS